MDQEFALTEAIYNCRAMRRIKTDEVPEELLLQLIDAANQAPSGSNSQKARGIVVRDPAIKKQLAEQNRKFAAPYISADCREPSNPKNEAYARRGRMADGAHARDSCPYCGVL